MTPVPVSVPVCVCAGFLRGDHGEILLLRRFAQEQLGPGVRCFLAEISQPLQVRARRAASPPRHFNSSLESIYPGVIVEVTHIVQLNMCILLLISTIVVESKCAPGYWT